MKLIFRIRTIDFFKKTPVEKENWILDMCSCNPYTISLHYKYDKDKIFEKCSTPLSHKKL